MNRIDHVVVGSADLDAGIEWVAARTGVAPVQGGSHEGLGTRNALLGLGDGQYLEVLALDPEQDRPTGSPHPSVGLPAGGHITALTITAPDVERLRPLGLDAQLRAGPWQLEVAIDGRPLA